MFVPFVFKASPPFLRRPGKYPPECGSPGNTWNKEASLSSLLFPCASFRANNSYLRSWIILIILLENDFIISCNTVTHFIISCNTVTHFSKKKLLPKKIRNLLTAFCGLDITKIAKERNKKICFLYYAWKKIINNHMKILIKLWFFYTEL